MNVLTTFKTTLGQLDEVAKLATLARTVNDGTEALRAVSRARVAARQAFEGAEQLAGMRLTGPHADLAGDALGRAVQEATDARTIIDDVVQAHRAGDRFVWKSDHQLGLIELDATTAMQQLQRARRLTFQP